MSICLFVAARSLIDLAASRLALRAPALRAATALTRPNQSAQGLPCGRHSVPTAETVDPSDVVANHCVESSEHLTHHRYNHDLRLLSGGLEAIVECLERRIPITGAHGRHVEHAPDLRSTTPDAALPFELAALKGVGRHANERGNLLAVHLPELRQERDQRAGQNLTDAGHGGEQPVALRERGIGGD